MHDASAVLGMPLALPCGACLKNRLIKSAMSDSLGDGRGNPKEAQIRLYERWAGGGAALSLVGEVHGFSATARESMAEGLGQFPLAPIPLVSLVSQLLSCWGVAIGQGMDEDRAGLAVRIPWPGDAFQHTTRNDFNNARTVPGASPNGRE